MKSIVLISISLLIFFCSKCLSQSSDPVMHSYILNILEEQGKTVEKIELSYKIIESDTIKMDTTYTIPLPNRIVVNYIPSPYKTYSKLYYSAFDFEIIGEDFYDKGFLTAMSDGKSADMGLSIREDTIILEKINYNLILRDVDGVPVEGAKIEYTITCNSRLLKKSESFTNSEGEFSTYTYRDKKKSNSFLYSTLDYIIRKEGYYSEAGSLNLESPIQYLKLVKPIDYLNKEFISSSSGKKLKEETIKIIDLILEQSLLSDSYLELRSIGLVPFKRKNYITFKFINTTSYNSLKVSKYDMGKLLFDEVIRKILDPLNDYLGESKEFYGYDLSVIGLTKNFADEYAVNQKINFRFLIPKVTIKKYKNKDISGQQVLDGSVILMDDERIELKLQ